MFKDLIEYKDLFEAEPELFGFGVVTFLRDFGPWKKGQTVETLWFTTGDQASVQETDFDGKPIKSCKFTLTAL